MYFSDGDQVLGKCGVQLVPLFLGEKLVKELLFEFFLRLLESLEESSLSLAERELGYFGPDGFDLSSESGRVEFVAVEGFEIILERLDEFQDRLF